MSSAVQLDYARPVERRRRWLLVTVLVSFVFLAIALLLPSRTRPRDGPPFARCTSKLRLIGMAVQMYANENRGAFPPDFATLLVTEDLTAGDFLCYASGDTPATGPTTQSVAADLTAGGHLSYVYTGKGLDFRSPANAVVAYEPLTHHGTVMHVLLADGQVDHVDASKAPRLLAELGAGHNPPRAGEGGK